MEAVLPRRLGAGIRAAARQPSVIGFVGGAVVLGLVFWAFPGIDLWAAGLFFRQGEGFFLKDSGFALFFYESIRTLTPVLIGALIVMLAIACIRRVRPFGFGVASAMQRVRGALAIGGEAFDVTGRDRPVERPGTPAPPLVLVDQHGARFDLASMRGTPVLVTFAFAHCEVVCPTVVQEVRAARRDAGAARMPMVIVTLDPWRDVPARLPHMARDWQLTEGDRVLSGTVEEVNAALDAWRVPRSRDTSTGEVAHATVVLVVDAQGRIDARMQEGFYRLRSLLTAGPPTQ